MRCRLLLALFCLVEAGACGSNNASTKVALGGMCQSVDDCQSGECLTVTVGTTVCTIACVASSDCPSDMICSAVPDNGSVCLPASIGGLCTEASQCPAGFQCDTTSDHCYIPVSRTLCSPCTSPLQCPMGGACHGPLGEEYCTAACDGGDCPTGYSCDTIPETTAKQCVPSNSAQSCTTPRGLCAPCTTDAECGDPTEICVRNLASNEMFCGINCSSTSDCPSNFTCTDLSGQGAGPTQCVPNSGTCKGYCDTTDAGTVLSQCGYNETCDTSTFECQQASNGTLCSACQTNDDCVAAAPGSQCLENNCNGCPFQGERFCSPPCAPGATDGGMSCPTGFQCATVTGTASLSFCLPLSGTCLGGLGALGDDCTATGGDACASGICISTGAASVCSQSCTTSADCAGSYQCCALSGTGDNQYDCTSTVGADGGICAPNGGGFGADCSPGQPGCYEGLCLNLGTAQVCTVECPTGTTCPTNFTCQNGEMANGDGTTTSVPVCFPNGGGTTGADCTFGPAACESGLCLKRSIGNICTQACSATMACPNGYNCQDTNLTVATPPVTATNVCVPGRP